MLEIIVCVDGECMTGVVDDDKLHINYSHMDTAEKWNRFLKVFYQVAEDKGLLYMDVCVPLSFASDILPGYNNEIIYHDAYGVGVRTEIV